MVLGDKTCTPGIQHSPSAQLHWPSAMSYVILGTCPRDHDSQDTKPMPDYQDTKPQRLVTTRTSSGTSDVFCLDKTHLESLANSGRCMAPGYGVDRIEVEDHAHFSAQPHTQLPRRTLLAIPPLANDTKSLSSSAALRLAEDSLLLLPASAFDPWPSLRRSLRSAAVPRHIVGNDTHFHQYEPQLLQFPSQTNCVRSPLAISVLNTINPWARDWLQMRTNWKSVQPRPSVLGT